MKTRKVALTALSVVLATTLAACGGGDSDGVTSQAEVDTSAGLVIDGETIADKETYEVAKSQTLSLYSSYQESNEQAFIEAFTRDTGIKVDLMRLVPARLAERVLSEQGAGRLNADVIRTSDYDIVDSFTDAGVWNPYVVPGTEELEEVVIQDGNFSRVTNVVQTFGYNTRAVTEEEAPTSWADLLDEKWRGKIGISQGATGGSNVALNWFVEEKLEDGYWEKLAALQPTIYDGAGQKLTAFARGEVPVATTGSASVNVTATEDKAPIDFVVPEEGFVTFDYYLGRTATAKNAEAAEVFMNYNFSKRGQELFTELGDYSVRPDVAPPTALGRELPPLDSDKVWRMPLTEVGRQAEYSQHWAEAFNY
ncbi:ABC transporter substrate-binding protein [Rhodococcus sp. C26F]